MGRELEDCRWITGGKASGAKLSHRKSQFGFLMSHEVELLTEHGGRLCNRYCGRLGRVKTSGTRFRAKRGTRGTRMSLQ